MEQQMNVPISKSYHEQLKAIAGVEKKSMKDVVEGWVAKDGRGKEILERTKPIIDEIAGRIESSPEKKIGERKPVSE